MVTDSVDTRLIDEGMRRCALLWIEVPGGRTWPAWHVWVDHTAYVLSGPGEQPLPELPGQVVLVIRSKDTLGRLLRITADTRRLSAENRELREEWERVTAALRAGRLNSPPGDPVARWAEHNTVTALTPVGEAVEGPGSYDDASGAAPPLPTPATTASWRPWHARGRPQRRRRLRRRQG